MNHHYGDIRSRIAEAPKWWDEYAVPRYEDFAPDDSANIYASQAVLLHIDCQGCGTSFKVCMTSDSYAGLIPESGKPLSEWVELGEIHYGDPPNTGCCAAGPTMNSIPRRVLEFWDRDGKSRDWERRPNLERGIDVDWAR